MSGMNSSRPQARKPRIAVIGAGITGVSAACEVIGNGLDCQIFEAGDESNLGGIWTRQNRHSSLQVPSDFYRFHPEVEWSCLYPGREEILEQTRRLWNKFNLQPQTTFSCPVTQIHRVATSYIINDDTHGYFDSVIVAVGTCAQVSRPHLSGQEDFRGEILHSSEMDDADLQGKDVVVLGGGASAVEALEHAYNEKAATIHVVSRSDKWIVPRWRRLNVIMALVFYDFFGLFDTAIELFLRWWCYHDLNPLAPSDGPNKGVYSQTPVVNSRLFEILRAGDVTWTKGTCQQLSDKCVEIRPRSASQTFATSCDVCIYATGYTRPSLAFLDKFSNGYSPPHWYLQVFPPGNPTICAINSTWVHGIGSVGSSHIGMYTRLLIVYNLDPATKPSQNAMTRWIKAMDTTLKPAQGLEFITTAEVYVWFFLAILLTLALWKWGRFIMVGDRKLAPSLSGISSRHTSIATRQTTTKVGK